MDGILNFRDLSDASTSVLAPGRIFRTATPGKASSADASKILRDLGVSRLLDLRSEDEWEPEPGMLQSQFDEIRPFSRVDDDGDDNNNNNNNDDNLAAYERVIAEDNSAGRLVRYHTPLLDYDRYYKEIFERMSPIEKLKATVFTAQAGGFSSLIGFIRSRRIRGRASLR